MRESGSFAVLAEVKRFFMPDILAQNDLRRLAAFEPGFSLLGFVVTAIESFEPGFSRRYDSMPLRFRPPDSDLPSLRCHAATSSNSTSSFVQEPGSYAFLPGTAL